MEFALAIVTVLSLVMTLTMGVVTWRLVHEERRRSAARLAALAAEVQRGTPAATARPPATPRPPAAAAVPPSTTSRVTHRPAPDPVASMPMTPLVPPTDTDTVREPARDTAVAVGDLFVAPAPSTSTPGTRLVALGAAAAVVVGFIATMFLVFSDGGDHAATTTAEPRPPVELLALDHATEDRVLAIRGSVRNPNGAVTADQLAVVAMAFDEAGALVASERSPVERPSLPPGAASPFAIEVPATGVSRYRISFLIDDATVPHVDRRVAPPADAAGESS